MSLFNWYLQDGLLCGDLCLVTMRQCQYVSEKNTYKDPSFIQKQDNKYRRSHPNEHRFHLFVKLKIILVEDNIVTVMYEKHEKKIQLQNMDSYFYLNDTRKTKQEAELYVAKNCEIPG